MFVVISQDQYKDVAVICICEDVETAKLIARQRNEKYPSSYCWIQESELI